MPPRPLQSSRSLPSSLCSDRRGPRRTRQNVLASAQYYLDKGDYDRALDLLDKLLIDNAGDSDARALRDTAMRAKSGADATKAQEAAQAEASGQKVIAQSLDKLGQKLRTSATAGPTAAEVSKAEADVQRRAEADAGAARQRAEAAELARQNKELQDKMRAVNALVDKGKNAIDSGDFGGGDKLFSDAKDKFPDGEDEFAAQKPPT